MNARKHLLVVDDQRLDRTIAAHAASRVGFRVTEAETLQETEAILAAGARFDFVLLDLSLREEDGLQVLPLLSRHNPEAVVVLASGFDGRVLAASQRLASGLGLRVAGVLRKLILPNALQRILAQAPHTQSPHGETTRAVSPAQLRRALTDGSIRPWFQPKVSLSTKLTVGTEALARWIGADGILVSPDAFIPVAEQSGLIAELTDTMLSQALAVCARWRRFRPDCRVAVNVSPLLLDNPGLIDRIEQHLTRHGVPSGALTVEITESIGIPETATATEILTRLRIRGVNLSIDDFGTGHSSLRSLVQMPFNEMKIDQSFVREALTNRDSRKVVRASASLGRELGLKVVAEGVESHQVAEMVQDAGCDTGQGWLYGSAMSAEAIEGRLAQEITPNDPAAPLPEANPP